MKKDWGAFGVQMVKKLLFIFMGNLCYALAINLFLKPNRIAAGGFAGLAIALNPWLHVPTGVFVLILSAPLFVWAVFVKGWSFMLLGLAGSVLYTFEVDISALFLPAVTHDLLLAALCGGALNGLAAICFLEAETNSGGTDLLARLLLTRHRNLSLGTMFLFCDGAVVLVSMLVEKNLEIGIYGAIGIIVSSFVGDKLIAGMNRASVYYIIPSGPAEPIAEGIMSELQRGVTALQGRGMYADTERQVLMTVVKPAQGYKVKALVKRIDPGAFVFMARAAEVAGEGFVDVDASASIERKKDKRK
ncbi:MAG: YitT family protein [Oscillospiraceae bacterium]|nr:YitT family protein [Oscillospiraceae bacterium]